MKTWAVLIVCSFSLSFAAASPRCLHAQSSSAQISGSQGTMPLSVPTTIGTMPGRIPQDRLRKLRTELDEQEKQLKTRLASNGQPQGPVNWANPNIDPLDHLRPRAPSQTELQEDQKRLDLIHDAKRYIVEIEAALDIGALPEAATRLKTLSSSYSELSPVQEYLQANSVVRKNLSLLEAATALSQRSRETLEDQAKVVVDETQGLSEAVNYPPAASLFRSNLNEDVKLLKQRIESTPPSTPLRQSDCVLPPRLMRTTSQNVEEQITFLGSRWDALRSSLNEEIDYEGASRIVSANDSVRQLLGASIVAEMEARVTQGKAVRDCGTQLTTELLAAQAKQQEYAAKQLEHAEQVAAQRDYENRAKKATHFHGLFIGEPTTDPAVAASSCKRVRLAQGYEIFVSSGKDVCTFSVDNFGLINQIVEFSHSFSDEVYAHLRTVYGSPLPGLYRILSSDPNDATLWRRDDGTSIAMEPKMDTVMGRPMRYVLIVVSN